jgi:putative PIN family toxin of toxin-antitoxin system
VRVVADTNTVVSAFLWGGAPAEVLTAAREQRLTLFTSAALIAELEDVLTREKFAARIAQVGSTVAEMIAGYRALAQLVRTTAMAPVSRDPDDDQVLACALAADAGFIVTRDQDLRTLDPFRTIRILPAREALALIAQPRG